MATIIADTRYIHHVMRFDGASRGNPGHGGGAWSINIVNIITNKVSYYGPKEGYSDHSSWEELPETTEEMQFFDSMYFGSKCTSNQSEYKAMLGGLQACLDRQQDLQILKLVIQGDSELIIKQMKREYEVRHKKLVKLYHEACHLANAIRVPITFEWIPREQNSHADAIANAIIDQKLGIGEEDGECSNDEEEERMQNFGFTNEELNILLSLGMKPWESDINDCFSLIDAYKSGETDADGEPVYFRFLSSSSMFDD